jgi:hypothetical protein
LSGQQAVVTDNCDMVHVEQVDHILNAIHHRKLEIDDLKKKLVEHGRRWDLEVGACLGDAHYLFCTKH